MISPFKILHNKPWWVLAIGLALAAAVPWIASEFIASVALGCLMYIALATSWSLFCGATRYLSLATSAFFGLGAYASATLLDVLPWPLVILSGAAIASAVAVLMGAAVLHLRGTYFAVLTFGMTELIRHAVTFVEKQVSGTVGRVLTVVPSNETVYLTVLAIAGAAIATALLVKRSRFGLALAGIGADEQRAQTLGVDTRRVKIMGFALTAAFAGAVGAAMAVRWTYIDPPAVFSPFIGFQTVLIAMIGGARQHRRAGGRGHRLQPAGRDAAAAAALRLHDGAGAAADPVRDVPAEWPGVAVAAQGGGAAEARP
jgi:branched-chain amino acid transport system permease protein